ncbi:MAG: hypothetical protein MJ182_09015 [Treponema sp.]|nr:hypothetical protein [Treponema sp.]
MAASVKDIIAGRKTFFITPDRTIFPEDFCEEYLAQGYECYFIENEKKISIEEKIEIMISVFNDVILFFNLDSNIPGVDWAELIKRLREKHGDSVLMGALFTKRQSKDEKARIEYKYLFDLGLNCGCIQLEYQKKQNFGIIEKVLFANQAMGRRKNVRALGTAGCTFGFDYNGESFTGVLQDISVSHFSFVFPKDKLNMKDYEKVRDIQLNLKGLHFRYDAVLFMKRELLDDNVLYVFMFANQFGAGLDPMTQQILIPRLYDLMHDNCKGLLHRLYDSYVKKNAVEDGVPLEEMNLLEEEMEEEDCQDKKDNKGGEIRYKDDL